MATTYVASAMRGAELHGARIPALITGTSDQ